MSEIVTEWMVATLNHPQAAKTFKFLRFTFKFYLKSIVCRIQTHAGTPSCEHWGA